MAVTASGDGAGWTGVEDLSVDEPQGLAYRQMNHIAKALRKRSNKEHEAYGDSTAGGEHVPGWCKILKHVDATADVSGAKDATLFQFNGLVHSATNQTLWCITGAASDPTILLIDPDKQYKGGDITWTGSHQYDASVDMTILKCVSGTFQYLVVESSMNFHGPADMSDTQIDGTLTVLDRADFSCIGVAGDSTITGAMQFDGSAQFRGLVSFCANNVYDSSWFDCSIKGAYTKTHDLSSTALIYSLYFKDTANEFSLGVNRIYSSFGPYTENNEERGANIHNITTTQLTVQAGREYVASVFTADGTGINCTSGQYRIIAMRLV